MYTGKTSSCYYSSSARNTRVSSAVRENLSVGILPVSTLLIACQQSFYIRPTIADGTYGRQRREAGTVAAPCIPRFPRPVTGRQSLANGYLLNYLGLEYLFLYIKVWECFCRVEIWWRCLAKGMLRSGCCVWGRDRAKIKVVDDLDRWHILVGTLDVSRRGESLFTQVPRHSSEPVKVTLSSLWPLGCSIARSVMRARFTEVLTVRKT